MSHVPHSTWHGAEPQVAMCDSGVTNPSAFRKRQLAQTCAVVRCQTIGKGVDWGGGARGCVLPDCPQIRLLLKLCVDQKKGIRSLYLAGGPQVVTVPDSRIS